MPRYDFTAWSNEYAKKQDEQNLRTGLYRALLDNKAMEMTNTITHKIEITPDMVQRAYDAVPDKLLFKSTVEAMLDAAINPPSEPEITVTDEMRQSGIQAWNSNCSPLTPIGEALLPNIYRAMRKLEPKAK